jgi:hypothetical protein
MLPVSMRYSISVALSPAIARLLATHTERSTAGSTLGDVPPFICQRQPLLNYSWRKSN